MEEDPFRSERLIYRAVEPSEDEAFFLAIQTDPLAYRNSNASVNRPQGKAGAVKYMKAVAEETLLGVVICLPAPSTAPIAGVVGKPIPIGCIHLDAMRPQISHHRFSKIGIDILKPYQGQGYGSEAIRWLLHWAFDTYGLHRVVIQAFEYNTGAVRLYERLGFVKEGVGREEIWHAGRWWDRVDFSMLDREWRALLQSEAVEKKGAGQG